MTHEPEKPTGASQAIAVLEKHGLKTGFVPCTRKPRKERRKLRAEQRHGVISSTSASSASLR